MFRGVVRVVFGLFLSSFAVGCGSNGGPQLADAVGTVTSNGEPVSDASVTFVPQSGPVATATTDSTGRFALNTAGQPGAPVGPCKVSVILLASAPDPTANLPPEERTRELTKMMGQAKGKFGVKEKKSLVHEKYAKVETSGLAFTVSPNASENDFKIALEQ